MLERIINRFPNRLIETIGYPFSLKDIRGVLLDEAHDPSGPSILFVQSSSSVASGHHTSRRCLQARLQTLPLCTWCPEPSYLQIWSSQATGMTGSQKIQMSTSFPNGMPSTQLISHRQNMDHVLACLLCEHGVNLRMKPAAFLLEEASSVLEDRYQKTLKAYFLHVATAERIVRWPTQQQELHHVISSCNLALWEVYPQIKETVAWGWGETGSSCS